MRLSTMVLVLVGLTACFEDGLDLDTGISADFGSGDCDVSIPEDAVMVEGHGRTVDASGPVWVCTGADVQSDGADAELFVESNGTAVINGANSVIWARNGSTITNYATNVTIYTDDPAGVTDLAWSATVIECDVAFDGGC